MPTRPPRLVGAERQAMARELAHRYEQGASIRALAREIGRSYGLCQRLLTEAGVQFRARGGANPASPQVRAQQAHRSEDPSHDPAARVSTPITSAAMTVTALPAPIPRISKTVAVASTAEIASEVSQPIEVSHEMMPGTFWPCTPKAARESTIVGAEPR